MPYYASATEETSVKAVYTDTVWAEADAVYGYGFARKDDANYNAAVTVACRHVGWSTGVHVRSDYVADWGVDRMARYVDADLLRPPTPKICYLDTIVTPACVVIRASDTPNESISTNDQPRAVIDVVVFNKKMENSADVIGSIPEFYSNPPTYPQHYFVTHTMSNTEWADYRDPSVGFVWSRAVTHTLGEAAEVVADVLDDAGLYAPDRRMVQYEGQEMVSSRVAVDVKDFRIERATIHIYEDMVRVYTLARFRP